MDGVGGRSVLLAKQARRLRKKGRVQGARAVEGRGVLPVRRALTRRSATLIERKQTGLTKRKHNDVTPMVRFESFSHIPPMKGV